MSVLRSILELFYPQRCVFCGDVLPFGKERQVCSRCVGRLPLVEPPVCIVCGQSMSLCRCGGKEQGVEGMIAPFYYSGLVRQSLHRFKFRGCREYAGLYADAMLRCVERCYAHRTFHVVTFVPMSPDREKRRGYNQAELLARELAERMGLPCRPLLQKVRRTGEQHGLRYADRQHNLLDAYRVTDDSLTEGAAVLLVDDVKTTGATLRECALTLRRGGARSVYAVCFALSPGEGREKEGEEEHAAALGEVGAERRL